MISILRVWRREEYNGKIGLDWEGESQDETAKDTFVKEKEGREEKEKGER